LPVRRWTSSATRSPRRFYRRRNPANTVNILNTFNTDNSPEIPAHLVPVQVFA
jgi:type 1 glutamine amidotransferase